jgi:DNA repair protein RadA/Sms
MNDSNDNKGLLSIESTHYDELPLSDNLAWLKSRISKFVQGGVYLLAGQPGIGKSRLSAQIALDLGRNNIRSLYILTEQSKEELAKIARQMTANWPQEAAILALKNVEPEETIYDIETLPSFLAHQVMSPSGKYHGVKLIVIDSIQGQGLAPGATTKYKQLYEFCRQCKGAGITVILVAHVTKRGDVAGPKDMEHNVDCVLVMRRAMIYRPLFVPKNRFGPAILKPIPLEMDKTTTVLKLSPHSETVSSVARSYLGKNVGIAEAQASVSLPAYGSRGKITAPGLPRREIEQLTTCISQLPNMQIEDLDYAIQCRLPGDRIYRSVLGLPLCMALIASYIQKDIPRHHIYLGEIDLLRKVREVPEQIIIDLWEELNDEDSNLKKPLRIFCPTESASILQEEVKGVTIVACERLDDAVYMTWPEISGAENNVGAR